MRVDGCGGGVLVFRCCRDWCLLGEVVRVVKRDAGVVEVVFSRMFSDWNLVNLGRERRDRLLRELAFRLLDELGLARGAKVRVVGKA